MSKIAVRTVLVLAVVIAIAGGIVSVLKLIPAKQRYPIARESETNAGTSASKLESVPSGVARNVVLIIGDGMGPSIVEATRLTSVGPSGRLEMETLPVRGVVSTRSADDLVTDSGAAATALATGVKTNNHVISLDPEGHELRTIVEAAEAADFATGLVTTTDVSDATPAAFGAHARSRYDRDEIAAALLDSHIEILMGSNPKHFLPVSKWGGHRTDGRNLLDEAASAGWTVARDLQELRDAASPPVVGIFDEDERPPLPDLALKSLHLFETTGKRFFLLLESEEIDSAAHDNDLGRTLSAVRELDQAVKIVIDWAKNDGSTVVVVTADHDTGGLEIIPSDSKKLLNVVWSTTSHTARDVRLYAVGPGAEALEGFHDNTDIAPIFARLLGIEADFRSGDR